MHNNFILNHHFATLLSNIQASIRKRIVLKEIFIGTNDGENIDIRRVSKEESWNR